MIMTNILMEHDDDADASDNPSYPKESQMFNQQIDNSYISFAFNKPWLFGNLSQPVITEEYALTQNFWLEDQIFKEEP